MVIFNSYVTNYQHFNHGRRRRSGSPEVDSRRRKSSRRQIHQLMDFPKIAGFYFMNPLKKWMDFRGSHILRNLHVG